MNNPLVVFIHQPKSGGSTFTKGDKKQGILARNCNHIRYPTQKVPAGGWDNITAISGHFNLDLVKNSDHFKHREKIFFTFLRDPINRLLSFYYFVDRMETVEKWMIVNKQSLPNKMTYYLASCKKLPTKYDLEKAKEILNNITFGITEQYDTSLKLFQNKYPDIFKDISYERLNVTKKKYSYDMQSDNVKNLLQEYNVLDKELYKYAKKLFKERIDEL